MDKSGLLGSALGMALQLPQSAVEGFCAPKAYHHLFQNWLGGYTPCFIDMSLLGVANLVAVVLSAIRLAQLGARRSTRLKLTGSAQIVHLAAAALSCLAFILVVLQLQARISGESLWHKDGGTPPGKALNIGHRMAPYEWTGSGLAAGAWGCLAAVFVTECGGCYLHSSTWMRRFPIVLLAAAEIAKFRFIVTGTASHGYYFWLYCLYFGITVILAVLSLSHWPDYSSIVVIPCSSEATYQPLSAADEEIGEDQSRVNPEAASSLWSTLTFGWMSPLMVKGYNKPLQAEDIFEVADDDRVEVVSKQFRIHWSAEMQKPDGPSLALASWRTIRAVFLSAVPFKLINDAAQFVGPFFLNKLLEIIPEGNEQTLGYTYAVLMFVGLMIGTICDNQHFNRVVRAGFRLRGTLTHQVFRQVLSLTPSARSDFSSGRIFSHVTSDAETLYQLSTSGLGLLSSPIRIIGAMSMLYIQLGWASLVAFVVLVLCLPLQAVLVRKSAKLLRKALLQTDERSKLEGEVIGGIDVVKCCAWEDPFWKKIQRVRNTELSILWKTFIIDATNGFLLNAIPTVVSVATFSIYVLAGNHLSAAKAFTSLSLFSILRMPLFQLPQLISQVINARVAIKRIETFLGAERQGDLQEEPPVQKGETAIRIQGEFTWDLSAPATLVDIDVTVPAGSFVAIVGATGAAKSSLLAAALGLMQQVAGAPVSVAGRVAFVPQAAFIYGNASVRDNILFGLPYDEERYSNAIQVSSLVTDLLQMPAGDDTELGERGVNVSGGQKQRIAIARAAYANADNILLDDPLSALDAKVAQEVFTNAVLGAWSDKTRMLVTNQLQYARPADLILFMSNGRITESGTYDDLMAASGGFASLMEQTESQQSEKKEEIGEEEKQSRQSAKLARRAASVSASQANLQELERKKEANRARQRTAQCEVDEDGRLVQKEGRTTGSVRWSTIRAWITAMGGFRAFLPLAACFLAAEILRVGSTVWLSHWTGVADLPGAHRAIWYLNIYAAISGTQTVIECARGFLANFLAVRSARHLHNGMLARLLRAPMSFFHTNPLGRIINRFTKDTSDVDRLLMGFTVMFCRSLLMLTSTIVLIGTVTPFALPPLVPILLLFFFLYRYFQATVREAKRLDSITRSPVYTSVGEAINGLSTIRAYKAEPRLIESNGRLIDRNVVCTLVQMSCNRWLSVRLETLGALSAFAASALAVEQGGAASTVGLSLSYALQITSLTNMVVRLASLAENAFNSVERINEYSTAEEEPLADIPGSCPDGWPSKGEIRFENVQMRYRIGLPLVLKGLTVTIPPACKAGVVGRTGAGKSSLINCLFRLMELDSGRIVVDGVDISRLGVQQLRSRMAIIPQVPVLFTGTLRENLDPFRAHTDAQVWAALRRAHLAPLVEANTEGLEMEMREGGAPLSAGQKQLAALARALLKQSKIIVLDEATANVDVETDALIQETVRNEFTDAKGGAATVIAIAHRLHTIIDCDMVLVMDAGRCAEVDSPAALLSNDDSLFSSMVAETGEASERFLRSAAKGEIDPRASLKRIASNARTRAAEPAKPSADGPNSCGAISTKARRAAGLLKAALAALAEAAEARHVREGEGGEAFSTVDEPYQDASVAASHDIAEALSTLGEVQLLSKQCLIEFGERRGANNSGGNSNRGGNSSRRSIEDDLPTSSRSSSVSNATRGTICDAFGRLSTDRGNCAASVPRASFAQEQLLPAMPEADSDDEVVNGTDPGRQRIDREQDLSPEAHANAQRQRRRLRGLRLLGVEGHRPSARCRTSNDLHDGHRDLQGP